METEVRRSSHLLGALIDSPQSFDFFQAVRVIKKYLHSQKNDGRLTFKSNSSFSYPTSDIVNLHISQLPDLFIEQFEILTSFLGLTGQNAVLPDHFTELLLERIGEKDLSLQAFLDIFHHRLMHCFYQIWESGKFFVVYEQSQENALNKGILGFIRGLSGKAKLTRDLNSTSENFLYYSGLYSLSSRPSDALKTMLRDYFEVPISIYHFVPEWIVIQQTERSFLSHQHDSQNQNRLGINTIIGKRVCHVQNQFEIEIGPVDYKHFLQLLPSGKMLMKIREMVRSFSGNEYDFHLRLILITNEVPRCCLSKQETKRLGWNSWLKTDVGLNHHVSVRFKQ